MSCRNGLTPMKTIRVSRRGICRKRHAHEPVDPVPETGWRVPFGLSRCAEKTGALLALAPLVRFHLAGTAAHSPRVLQALALKLLRVLVCLRVLRGSGSLVLAQRLCGQGGLWHCASSRHLLTHIQMV